LSLGSRGGGLQPAGADDTQPVLSISEQLKKEKILDLGFLLMKPNFHCA